MQINKFFSSLFGGDSLARSTLATSRAEAGSVVLDGVSKSFRRARKKSYTSVKSELLNREDLEDENNLVALNDINFEIKPGSSLGVIGRNGSGKSTLLKLIAGIYHPDRGSVDVSGRVSALIELGAGFHPDFSGRENVYLAGIMYGLTRKQVDARFDDIIKFAELEDFIDDPVRTYSSGMYMRLGFSVAAHTDPDILLIDEVLAVGDAAFIHRCHDTISEFRRRGKTLIFVTHDLSSVSRWCDEAVWLEKGNIKLRGEPKRVIDAYLQGVEEKHQRDLVEDNIQAGKEQKGSESYDNRNADDKRWGQGDVDLFNVRMLSEDGEAKWLFTSEDSVTIEVEYQINRLVDELVFGVGIVRADGLDVHGKNTDVDKFEVPLPSPEEVENLPVTGKYLYQIDRLGLVPGTYFVDVAAHRNDGCPYDYHHQLHKFSVRGENQGSGVYSPKTSWKVIPGYEVIEGVCKVKRA